MLADPACAQGTAAPARWYVVLHRRGFRLATRMGLAFLLAPGFILTLALQEHTSVVAVGWLALFATVPPLLTLGFAATLRGTWTYLVDDTGVTSFHGSRPAAFLPWARVRTVEHGVAHVAAARKRYRETFLFVQGEDRHGVLVSNLRHDIPRGLVLEATAVTELFARAHGVDIVETEIMDRSLWARLPALRRAPQHAA